MLVGKLQGKRPLGRHGHKGKGNMKMDVKEIECEGMNWIPLLQDKVQ
jgi:hypothetical protein